MLYLFERDFNTTFSNIKSLKFGAIKTEKFYFKIVKL